MERKRGGALEAAAGVAAFAVFLVAVAVLRLVFRDPDEAARNERLAALAAMRTAPPLSVTFHSGDRSVLIRDRALVAEFVSLLAEPQAVRAHHSHPTDGLRFELAGETSVYLLSRDSYVEGEFWLQTPAEGIDFTLKQLRSADLEPWLARHRIAFSPVAHPNGEIRK